MLGKPETDKRSVQYNGANLLSWPSHSNYWCILFDSGGYHPKASPPSQELLLSLSFRRCSVRVWYNILEDVWKVELFLTVQYIRTHQTNGYDRPVFLVNRKREQVEGSLSSLFFLRRNSDSSLGFRKQMPSAFESFLWWTFTVCSQSSCDRLTSIPSVAIHP